MALRIEMFSKINWKITVAIALAIVTGFVCLSRTSAQVAPPPVCIPYVPIIATESRSGSIPGGAGHCTPVSVSHEFGVPLVGDPIVTLLSYRLGFTNDENHFGQGRVMLSGPPFVEGSGTSVRFQVEVCHRDSDNSNDIFWSFSYSVAAWAQNEFIFP